MAMVTPNYYVNISKESEGTERFCHFCDVEFGNISKETAYERFGELVGRFPPQEGWLLELNKVECYGTTVLAENLAIDYFYEGEPDDEVEI